MHLFFSWCMETHWHSIYEKTSKTTTVCYISTRDRRQWQPTPVLLPGKSHGRRSLVGCSPWGREESDMTERLHFHFSLSRDGAGNGHPLQCSCLENPRDRGAWWAAVYGVAQSRTRPKRLSSSSSSSRPLLGYSQLTSWLSEAAMKNTPILNYIESLNPVRLYLRMKH